MSDLDLLRKMIREDVIVGARRTDSGRFSLGLKKQIRRKVRNTQSSCAMFPKNASPLRPTDSLLRKSFFEMTKDSAGDRITS